MGILPYSRGLLGITLVLAATSAPVPQELLPFPAGEDRPPHDADAAERIRAERLERRRANFAKRQPKKGTT